MTNKAAPGSRRLRPLAESDRSRIAEILTTSWGSTWMVSRGRHFNVLACAGFVAEDDREWHGYATYDLAAGELEITSLESLAPQRGVGGALLAACVEHALATDAKRIWLVTTNDNLPALRFYQRRGFALVALRAGAVDEARRSLKPEIPALGVDDIPIRDELELELPRRAWRDFVQRYAWPQS